MCFYERRSLISLLNAAKEQPLPLAMPPKSSALADDHPSKQRKRGLIMTVPGDKSANLCSSVTK